MADILFDYYEWLRALHIISAIFWMAGLLYLPRLFVYQIEAKTGGELSEALKKYQRLLLVRIMRPAMIATWSFALLMLWANSGLLTAPWMHVKLLCVLLMSGAHEFYAGTQRRLEQDQEVGSSRRWRLLNEIPAVLAIIIVIMAVVEPF